MTGKGSFPVGHEGLHRALLSRRVREALSMTPFHHPCNANFTVA